MTSAPRLPDGWTVRPDPRTWRVDGGATWIGGSPPRVLRLSAAARSRLGGPDLVVADATTAALAACFLLPAAGRAQSAAAGPSALGPSASDAARLVAALAAETPLASDLEALTDRIGGRPTGSEANRRAVAWGLDRFRQMGVSARAEPGADSLQRALLERERVRFDAQGRLDLGRYRWAAR